MSDLSPPSGTRLGHLDQLDNPGACLSDWQEDAVILVRKGDEVRAYLNVCPHAGRPLNLPDGRVFLHQGEFILCPVHGASFDLVNGQCAGGPAVGDRLTEIAIRLEGQEIWAA